MLLLDPIPYPFRREITCLPWNRSDITTAKETTAILVCACVSKTETLNCNRFFLTFITSHDSIIRKRLHQRLPLTFAKCQSFSDRSCNIFLELTRCRNFDVIPGPRMHVHQSRMLRRNLTWKKFVHWISHWGWKWLRWRKISIRFLEKFESFPKFRSPTLTTNNPIDSHDLTR